MRPLKPAALEWRDVSLQLGAFSVSDVSLRLDEGEWLGLIGPTGAGKTLLLEVAAGFLEPGFGRVLRDGRDVTRLPAELRDLAYVPQDDLLFPHLDVRSNLRFAARRGASPGPDSDFTSVVKELGIAHLLDRRVGTISGGEAQRVALGRALLAGSPVLLLDECTSALDEDTRDEVGDFLARRRESRGLAIVQVTHDRHEVFRRADQVVAMGDGRLLGPVPAPRADESRRILPLTASDRSP